MFGSGYSFSFSGNRRSASSFVPPPICTIIMSLIFTSSIGCPGIPAKIDCDRAQPRRTEHGDVAQESLAAITPTGTPDGPRIRAAQPQKDRRLHSHPAS